MTKSSMLFAAVAASALIGSMCAAPVWAGEGAGEPYAGPNAAVTTNTQSPKYTMGSAAPFNYYGANVPSSATSSFTGSRGAADPYPYRSAGQVIQTPDGAVVVGPHG